MLDILKKVLSWIIGKPGDAERYEQRLANVYKYGASGMSGYKINGQWIHYRESISKKSTFKKYLTKMFKKLTSTSQKEIIIKNNLEKLWDGHNYNGKYDYACTHEINKIIDRSNKD